MWKTSAFREGRKYDPNLRRRIATLNKTKTEQKKKNEMANCLVQYSVSNKPLNFNCLE